eukprot:gene10398-12769_t
MEQSNEKDNVVNPTTTTSGSLSIENTNDNNNQPSLGDVVSSSTTSTTDNFDEHIEKQVVSWMKEQLKKEMKRITDMGSRSVEVEVKNTGVIKEDNKVINRLELKTSFDFDKVVQIMISDSVECPHKKGYFYINVLLFTQKPIPLIVPYIFKKTKENKLTDWLFINNQFKRSQHKINEFHDV